MSVSIQIVLSEKLYLRDPMQTDLGRKILGASISMIDELGFEKFTFKKLGEKIESTEASVYRYFKNKHKLLIYLVSWHWAWLEYVIDYQTHNINDPLEQLKRVIATLSNAATVDPDFAHINEPALHRIVIAESSKAFHTKEIDGENEEGLFQGYKSLIGKISDILHAVNPKFRYPKALAVTMIVGTSKQLYYAEHLPTITEVKMDTQGATDVYKYMETLILNALEVK